MPWLQLIDDETRGIVVKTGIALCPVKYKIYCLCVGIDCSNDTNEYSVTYADGIVILSCLKAS